MASAQICQPTCLKGTAYPTSPAVASPIEAAIAEIRKRPPEPKGVWRYEFAVIIFGAVVLGWLVYATQAMSQGPTTSTTGNSSATVRTNL